jgi:hypothetical protein
MEVIEVFWRKGWPKGYTDILPLDLFFSERRIAKLEHDMRGPRPRQTLYPARCALTVKGRQALLDYAGAHKAFNLEHGVDLGIMRFTFSDAARSSAPAVDWKDEGASRFMRPDVEVTMRRVPDLEETEGTPQLIAHLVRERSSKLRRQKIRQAQMSGRGLACEACRFDFSHTYGEFGADFCEVHHEYRLADTGPRKNKLDDLAILCANCHRMIHKTNPILSVKDFTAMHVINRPFNQ